MSQALKEFNLRLLEIKSDLVFLNLAFELRPRINQVLNPENRGAVLDMARRFGAHMGGRAAAIYGPMFVRLVASFERYLRLLIQETVEAWANKADNFDQLPDGLGQRNVVLSGRYLASSDSPRDYLNIDLLALVDNLATCRTGVEKFKLNASSFTTVITGVTPDVIENGMKVIKIAEWWNAVGGDANLRGQLNTSRTPDTTKKSIARLKELSRWRNNWAHGGDEEVSLTHDEIISALEFLSAFSNALDTEISKQIAKK